MSRLTFFAERSLADEPPPPWNPNAARHFDDAFANPQRGPVESYADVLGRAQYAAEERFVTATQQFFGMRDLDVDAACLFASLVGQCAVDLNTAAGLYGELAAAVECGVVLSAFPALARRGAPRASFDWIVSAWQLHAIAFGALPEAVGRLLLPSTSPVTPLASLLHEMAIYNVAVGRFCVRRDQRDRTSHMVRALRAHLGLSYDDLGSMLQISGFEARRLENRQIEIDREQAARIGAMYAALERLLAIFRPERLPEVISRPAEAFGGQRALDWVLSGRIAEVAGHYEQAVQYQA
jgi:hypothetical protein